MSTSKRNNIGLPIIKKMLFLSIILLVTNAANAQLNRFEAMYFQNQYIGNPAMAGINKGVNLNIGYQGQWNDVPGSPALMYVTLEYNPESRVAYGLNFNNDKAGLITNTRVLGTFAYHLPLDGEDRKLNFGLSLGTRILSLDNSKVTGDIDDPSLQNFNQGAALDGDFGISYTTRLLTVQAAVPNLNNVFFENDDGERRYVDNQIFYSAISYKVFLSSRINDFNIEPLLAYRGIRGYKDIVDIGGRFNMPEYHLNISAMYHTNEAISGAFGVQLDKLGIFLSYSSYIGNNGAFANDSYEIGLRYNFLD